jgi:nitroimidazol reductase NimA-like FMN-containing flavoprotein (pyridoxamine 5'-phosphate oxidase superfamily)
VASANLIRPDPYDDLTVEECFDLLGSKHVGRVAFTVDGPVILPVNYVVDRESIIVRTSPYGYLGRCLRRCEAAFGVDEINEGTGAGWTVLVRGSAADLAGHEARHLQQHPRSWADGVHSLYLRIVPRMITGRRYCGASRV